MTAPATSQDDSFTKFVHDTYSIVHRCAVRLCRNETLAKDLTQESYIKILGTHSAADELEIGHALRALSWVTIDHFRKETRERRKLGEVGRLEAGRLAADPGKRVSDRSYVLWFMESLNPRQQEVYFLTEVGGFTAAEVGDLLGMASGTVSNYLTIIRRRLRERRSET